MSTIKPYVDQFIDFARNNPSKIFYVTEIGCGIAGFQVKDIAPLFGHAVEVANIYLPRRFWEILQNA